MNGSDGSGNSTSSLANGATRRQALALLGGAAGFVVLGRRARAQEGTPSAAVGTEWSFTDDAGKTVTLPSRPERIVADLSAAAALWDFGIKPLAVSGGAWNLNSETAWGNIDRATPVISPGSAESGAPDVEKLLQLDPDLFVTLTWGVPDNPYSWSFPEPALYEQVNEIVPVVAISATGSAERNVKRFAELAELLGADLQAPSVVESKAAFDATAAEFSQLTASNPDLTAIFVHADEEGESVANPEDWADLTTFRDLGLYIIEPDVEPGSYWEHLSAEQVGKYQADVIFQSTREGLLDLDGIKAHPTFSQLPAARAGQVGDWNTDVIQSYQGLTEALESMLEALRNSRDVTD